MSATRPRWGAAASTTRKLRAGTTRRSTAAATARRSTAAGDGEVHSSYKGSPFTSSSTSSTPCSASATPQAKPPGFFVCIYCDRKFYSSQALGGHQNVHKYERTLAKRRREIAAAMRAHGARVVDAAAGRPDGGAGGGVDGADAAGAESLMARLQVVAWQQTAAAGPALGQSSGHLRGKSSSALEHGVERAASWTCRSNYD